MFDSYTDTRTYQKEAVAVARDALAYAQAARAQQRHRKSPARLESLRAAESAVMAALAEVKRYTYSARYNYFEHEEDLRRASDALQREKRKLRKMIRTSEVRSA